MTNPDRHSTDPRSDSNSRVLRRDLLAGLGIVGLGAVGAGQVSAATDDETSFEDHDHSGAFGAASRLGEEAPVESITVEDLQTTDTPVVDVRAYGVVGDGSTDDSAAFQDAIYAARPHGILYVPYDLRVWLESPVEIDLSGPSHNRFSFICHGAITPAPGIGNAITISQGNRIYVFARIDNGGRDIESDTAVLLEEMDASLIEGQASNFNGRVFEMVESSTCSIGFLRTANCGQSLAVFNSSPLGEFRDGFDVSPTRAPEFHDTSDIQINQYENFVHSGNERGLVFDNCLSVFCDKVAVGGAANVPIIEVKRTGNANFSSLHLGGAPDVGALIENTQNANFQIFCNQCNVGVRYTGNRTRSNRVIVNAREMGTATVEIEENVPVGGHYFSGNVEGGNVGVDIQSTSARVHLDHFRSIHCATDLQLPADGNNVRVTNSALGSIDGRPRVYNGVAVESAAEAFPGRIDYEVGTAVLFTDPEDGSGNGLYLRIDLDKWYRLNDGEIFEVDPFAEDVDFRQAGGGDDELPGPGLVGTAAGVGAAGYLWSQWRRDAENS